MNCVINSAIALLKGQPAQCVQSGAIAIAVVAFVLGVVVALVLCKLLCPCKKQAAKKPVANGAAKAAHNKDNKSGEEKPFEKRKPHPAPADGSVEIYVGNLSYDMTEQQLRDTFAAFGTVSQCRLVVNKFNGRSKGFGFVQMPNRAEAEKACAELNDHEVCGRVMKCNEAKNLI